MGRLAETMAPGYGYPAEPGFKEKGGASEAAASVVTDTVTSMRAAVLAVIRTHPSTADEVAEKLGLSILSIRPRVSELRHFNKIAPNGQRRRNTVSGVSATVWMERK